MSKATDNGIGRPRIFGQNMNRSQNVYNALIAMESETPPSVYLLKQLKDAGLVKSVPIKTEKRGRPAFRWQYTKRATKLILAVWGRMEKETQEKNELTP